MKRVSEIDQELKDLSEKRAKLERERSSHVSVAAIELRKQYLVVYGWYEDEDADIRFPDLIFATRKSATEKVHKSMEKTWIYALASEELSDTRMLELIQ